MMPCWQQTGTGPQTAFKEVELVLKSCTSTGAWVGAKREGRGVLSIVKRGQEINDTSPNTLKVIYYTKTIDSVFRAL